MKSANKPSDEELFRKAMADVEPLRVDNRIDPVPRKHPRVVAFASCRPVDGGTGATDVLLSLQTGRKK